jgi:hypothetical protein
MYYTIHRMKAKNLLPDDRIYIGDDMYRIINVKINIFNQMILICRPMDRVDKRSTTLIVPKKAKFTVFNQKQQ